MNTGGQTNRFSICLEENKTRLRNRMARECDFHFCTFKRRLNLTNLQFVFILNCVVFISCLIGSFYDFMGSFVVYFKSMGLTAIKHI